MSVNSLMRVDLNIAPSHINSGCTVRDGESGVGSRESGVGECGIIDFDLIVPIQPETISRALLTQKVV